jgi:cytochrome d ubiquinol oxidase subunit II
MPPDRLVDLVAALALLVVVMYAVLGGADFGGGVWDLLARGPRAPAQRDAIARAIGPVWEANHVWLIFLIVILFTAFPIGFGDLSVALYWPFHLVLAGVVLRGASFVFSAPGRAAGRTPIAWGAAFGAASAITPLVLGANLGAVSSGGIRVLPGGQVTGATAWLAPFPLATGFLALAVSSYLAAVYLTIETTGPLQEDFRQRALAAWLVAGVLALATLVLMRVEVPAFWDRLVTGWSAACLAAGIMLAPASALAMAGRRFPLARVTAIGQVIALLCGWALALWPYLIYPDVTLTAAAAPPATLQFLLATLPIGLGLVLPSLWFLFAVFKGRNPAAPSPQSAATPAGPDGHPDP